MTRPMLDFDYCGHGVFWANSGNMSFMIEGQVMDGSPYECTTYLNKRTIFQGLGEAMGRPVVSGRGRGPISFALSLR
jgi:hypothetical protein